MTLTVLGQKADEILRSCKGILQGLERIDRRLAKKPVNDKASGNNEGANGQKKDKTEAPFRYCPDDSYGNDNQIPCPPLKRSKLSISDRIQMTLAVITLGAVLSSVINNYETKALVKTAQDTYETTNRPYVGLSTASATHAGLGNDGKTFFSPQKTENTTQLNVSAVIKNFGSAPGEKFDPIWNAQIDGRIVQGHKVPAGPGIIFPNQEVVFAASFGEPDYSKIVSGTSTLQVTFDVKYEAHEKSYRYCTTQQYNPRSSAFINLGTLRPLSILVPRVLLLLSELTLRQVLARTIVCVKRYI